jgi:hypothetical protein
VNGPEKYKLSTAEKNKANEAFFLTTGGLTTLANRLASPQIVLPWVYHLIGGPLFLIGILIPSLRMGGLLAQITIIPTLLAMKFRKWAYVVASFLVAATLIAICTATLEFAVGGATLVFFASTLILGSCWGIIQLTSQEVMAKSVSPKRIGLLLARQASIGGLLTLILIAVTMYLLPQNGEKSQHLVLIVLAALAMVLAGAVFALVREPDSAAQPKHSIWVEIRKGWALYRTTPWFRRFFTARALLLSVGLATPFYSIHAASQEHSSAQGLSLFVLATGVTNVFSGFVWSGMLGRDPTRVMFWSGILAATAGGVAMLRAAVPALSFLVIYVIVFSLLELAVQGLTQASKTYLALMAPTADRPRYLAINNALLGVLAIFVSGLIGIVAHSTHIYGALGLLMLLGLLAGSSARRLMNPAARAVDAT